MELYIAEIVVSRKGPVVGKLLHNVWAVSPTDALYIAGCFAAAMSNANEMYDFGVTNVVAAKDANK